MTTRTLVILRHAKTDRSDTLADLDRPLTERGHADAGAAGAWLAARGYRPDLVVCSPARRTRQTWHGVAVALEQKDAPEVRYEPGLYGAGGPDDVLELLRTLPDEVSTVLLVGHNPTLSQLSVALDPAGQRDSDGLSTCGLAVHEVAGPWSELVPGASKLVAAHTARA
jgi:phosphohistidine phosphatase